MEPTRIGIIGLGIMGKQYARVFSEHPLSKVVAVCAKVPEQVEEARHRYGAAGCLEHREMLDSTVDSLMQVIGTSGHVCLDRKRESIEISTEKKFSYPKGFLISDTFGRLRGAFPMCLEDFLLALRNDTEPHVNGIDGRQVTAALEAIHESLRTGGSVAVAPLPEAASA